MLHELSIENVGIFARAQVNFGPGLTAITGETGAGKSLVVNSIELCLGGRADPSMVRSGATKAIVAAVFEIGGASRALLQDAGVETEEGSVYILRDLVAEGKSQCRINSRLTPVSVLKRIGEQLVDLHGQHENQTILYAAAHLAIFDSWLGPEALQLRSEIGETYRRRNEKLAAFTELQESERNRAREIDLLQYQVEEIESVCPVVGEYEKLINDVSRLRNAARLRELLNESFELLYSGDNSARQSAAGASKKMAEAAEIDQSLQPATAVVEQALFELENAVATLREAFMTLEGDATRLETVEARITQLQALRRKYGENESAIIEFLEIGKARLSQLINFDLSKAELEREIASLNELLTEKTIRLTGMRAGGSGKFESAVCNELADLAMTKAQLKVDIKPKPISSDGADALEFLFTANVGEALKPLIKIASGGELSRLTLAIKTILAGREGPATLIFDEVDAGLGGEAAIVLGRKLSKLSEHYQVIIITHLPQVAAFASSHSRIEKSEIGGRTVATIEPLEYGQRVEELARMLAGEGSGTHARGTAEELLATAGNSQIRPKIR